MKTNEEIKARYLSEDSDDFFGAQRAALLCMLPLDVAAPYLNPAYVEACKDGSIPEDEKWEENFVAKDHILKIIPDLYEAIRIGDIMHCVEGLLYLKAWIWTIDTEFHDEIHSIYDGAIDEGTTKDLVDKIASHFDYKPTIEDIAFEEIPAEDPKK